MKVSADRKIASTFITIDIETLNKGGKLIPYLICGWLRPNGSEYITSYGLDQEKLFKTFIDKLLNEAFTSANKLIVYAHNLSGFDGIYLMRHLLSYGKVEPLLFNGKLMSIKVKTTSGKTIIFKDSFLLLPLSLRILCKAFEVSAPKGYFPFNLTDIYYTGVFPKFNYWTGISINIYNSLKLQHKNKFWDFEKESIEYCKLDCKSLHEVLTKFNEFVFNEFQVNIHKVLTLPALAMRIYKTHFMGKNTIYQLGGEVEQNIRKSYSGGSVDVYIPHNKVNPLANIIRYVILYYYDVNSLYPYIMANAPMPTGKPIPFAGDIRNIDPKAFGFFYCKITSPKYLEHPILQRRVRTENGLRTIAGCLSIGIWTGWIYSAELDNAIKYGYQFEIFKGYQFKKGYIFKEYVNKMYNLRLEYDKGHAMNLIAKLLMNSLYGKFGMKVESSVVEIFNTSNETELSLFKEMLNVYGETLLDFNKIDSHYVTVRKSLHNFIYTEEEDMYHGLDVNIAIASAITGGARMWMSTLKNNPNFNLYYSDTDSAVTDRPLPEFLVGKELGQFKLECVIRRAVFLAPKVYGLITTTGEEIIKVKGMSPADVKIQDLENLLVKDSSKEFNQSKWFKKVIAGEISVTDVAYTLKVTSNKRQAVYIDNVFSNTKPFQYDEIVNKIN
jgi:hypothetical protein